MKCFLNFSWLLVKGVVFPSADFKYFDHSVTGSVGVKMNILSEKIHKQVPLDIVFLLEKNCKAGRDSEGFHMKFIITRLWVLQKFEDSNLPYLDFFRMWNTLLLLRHGFDRVF